MQRIDLFLVREEDTVKDVMKVIDHAGFGIALVIDKDRKLKGTVTDGDIRRSILNGADVKQHVSEIMNRSPNGIGFFVFNGNLIAATLIEITTIQVHFLRCYFSRTISNETVTYK